MSTAVAFGSSTKNRGEKKRSQSLSGFGLSLNFFFFPKLFQFAPTILSLCHYWCLGQSQFMAVKTLKVKSGNR